MKMHIQKITNQFEGLHEDTKSKKAIDLPQLQLSNE
jgi:hypothetical protein